MGNIKVTKNPYLLFSPFLLFFMMYAIKFYSNTLIGDEEKYLNYAQNLINGFHSLSNWGLYLWCGPGYPIIIMPFVALHLPRICMTLLNAVFIYLSIVFLFKSLMQFVTFRIAMIFTLFWAFCYNAYEYISIVYTEPLTIILISLFIFSIIRSFTMNSRNMELVNKQMQPGYIIPPYSNLLRNNRYIYLSGFILGYIALTKIIFGYVLLLLFVGSALLWIKNRNRINYRKGALIMLIAFATTMPYLVYTWHATGKLFYWGYSGGMSLYWMSTPYENEYGDWKHQILSRNWNPADSASDRVKLFKLHHQKDYDEAAKYNLIGQDSAFKKIAFHYIKEYPKKYLINIKSNVSRLLFDFPYTFNYQNAGNKVWYFAIIYTLTLFSFIVTLANWKKIEYCVRFLFIFLFIYLFISSLVSAYNRQFIVIVPELLFWIAYIMQKSVTIKIKGDATN